MKWPWVSRRYSEQLERDISYRDVVIEQIRRERDSAIVQSQRATDELIMRLGAAPITEPVRADVTEMNKKAEELAQAFNESMAEVDAETRLVHEMVDDEAKN